MHLIHLSGCSFCPLVIVSVVALMGFLEGLSVTKPGI